jgi:hypothetical protein
MSPKPDQTDGSYTACVPTGASTVLLRLLLDFRVWQPAYSTASGSRRTLPVIVAVIGRRLSAPGGKLIKYVSLRSGVYRTVVHGSLDEVKVRVVRAQVLDQRVVPVGSVADEFGDQSQFKDDRRDGVLAERCVDIVLPRAAADALEGVRVCWHLDGAGAHVDVVHCEVGEVLPGVGQPCWRLLAGELGQGVGESLDLRSPSDQDVDVAGRKADVLGESGARAHEPVLETRRGGVQAVQNQRQDLLQLRSVAKRPCLATRLHRVIVPSGYDSDSSSSADGQRGSYAILDLTAIADGSVAEGGDRPGAAPPPG